MGFWILLAYASGRFLQYFVFLSGGVVRMRIRINERLLMDRFNMFLATKPMLQEERDYHDHNTVVFYSWDEKSRMADFGYSAPRITCEYDRATGFLLSIYIEYNRRAARRNQALTGAEVRNKVCEDMVKAGFFENPAFTFKEDIILAGAEDLRAFSQPAK